MQPAEKVTAARLRGLQGKWAKSHLGVAYVAVVCILLFTIPLFYVRVSDAYMTELLAYTLGLNENYQLRWHIAN